MQVSQGLENLEKANCWGRGGGHRPGPPEINTDRARNGLYK